MTASVMTDEPTVTVVQSPRRTRSRVLFEDFQAVADKVREKPGQWHLVGGGPSTRYGVFSQTAYRIRRGLIKAFAEPYGGAWEVQVSTDQRVEREHEVEVYLRFVPAKAS